MGEDRVSGLALMNLNIEMEINLHIISGMFAQKNKRRMFTKCILYDYYACDCDRLFGFGQTHNIQNGPKNWTIFCFA